MSGWLSRHRHRDIRRRIRVALTTAIADQERGERRRQASSWYQEFVEQLLDHPSEPDLRSAVAAAGEFDPGELKRAIHELSDRAADEHRPAEHALLGYLTRAVDRALLEPAPAVLPGLAEVADIDFGSAASAGVTRKQLEITLAEAEASLIKGRYSGCLTTSDEALALLNGLSDEQLRYVVPAAAFSARSTAEELRAQAFVKLERLDEAQAAYDSLVHSTEPNAIRHLGRLDHQRIRMTGLAGLAQVQRRRGHLDAATHTAREHVRLAAVRGRMAEQRAGLNNLGLALLAAERPKLALDQFRQAREISSAHGPNAFTRFGEADALRALGDADLAEEIYRRELQQAVAEDDWLPIGLYADRLSSGAIRPSPDDLAVLAVARARVQEIDTPRFEVDLAIALVNALRAGKRHGEAIAIGRDVLGRASRLDQASGSVLKLRLQLALVLFDLPARSPSIEVEARTQLDMVIAAVDRLVG